MMTSLPTKHTTTHCLRIFNLRQFQFGYRKNIKRHFVTSSCGRTYNQKVTCCADVAHGITQPNVATFKEGPGVLNVDLILLQKQLYAILDINPPVPGDEAWQKFSSNNSQYILATLNYMLIIHIRLTKAKSGDYQWIGTNMTVKLPEERLELLPHLEQLLYKGRKLYTDGSGIQLVLRKRPDILSNISFLLFGIQYLPSKVCAIVCLVLTMYVNSYHCQANPAHPDLLQILTICHQIYDHKHPGSYCHYLKSLLAMVQAISTSPEQNHIPTLAAIATHYYATKADYATDQTQLQLRHLAQYTPPMIQALFDGYGSVRLNRAVQCTVRLNFTLSRAGPSSFQQLVELQRFLGAGKIAMRGQQVCLTIRSPDVLWKRVVEPYVLMDEGLRTNVERTRLRVQLILLFVDGQQWYREGLEQIYELYEGLGPRQAKTVGKWRLMGWGDRDEGAPQRVAAGDELGYVKYE